MSALLPRPLASLSSGLLARKGQARPAMRPQGLVTFADAAPTDDLGWNDMGGQAAAAPLSDPEPAPEPAPVPAVLVERATLRREVERPARPVEAPAATTGLRAAFTLRLDAHRHLRLRLASASANRSAQQLMIQALDAMLAQLPEVERLATQLPAPGGAA